MTKQTNDRPSGMNLALVDVKERLYAMLEVDASEVIEKQLERALDAEEHGNRLGAYLNLSRLELLLIELQHLRQNELEAYRRIRKDLVAVRNDRGGFQGTRFEVHVAAQLSAMGLSYKKQESPDFVVGEVVIECGSCRRMEGKSDVRRKLSDTIEAKAAKPYAGKNCLLAIDVTNLLFHEDPTEWQAILDQLTTDAEDQANFRGYGAIGLFLFRQAQDLRSRPGYVNNMVVSSGATAELVQFVEQHYPQIGVSTKGPAIPKEG